MNHSIEIIEATKYYSVVMINNETMKLTRVGRRSPSYRTADVADIDSLENLLNCFDLCIKDHNDFTPLTKETFSTNILIILNKLYHDEAMAIWKDIVAKAYIRDGHISGKRLLRQQFNRVSSPAFMNLPLVIEMQKYVKDFFVCENNIDLVLNNGGIFYASNERRSNSYRRFQFNHDKAVCGAIQINVRSRNSNIIDYCVNGVSCSICTSKRPEMKYAENIASAIYQLSIAFAHQNSKEIQSAINQMGKRAASQVIEGLFLNEAITFFDMRIKERIARRQRPALSSLVKQWFGGYSNHLSITILTYFEPMLNIYEESLLDGNDAEIEKEGNKWILYCRFEESNLKMLTLMFDGPNLLMREFRSYLRFQYKKSKGTDNKTISCTISRILRVHDYLITFFVWLMEDDIEISSICDLTIWQVKQYYAFLVHESGLKPTTIYASASCLCSLYDYICLSNPYKEKRLNKKSFPFLDRGWDSVQHYPPLSPYSIGKILTAFHEFPEHIRLAFLLSYFTGARTKTICLLTTDSIIHSGDEYFVRLYYYKNAEQRQARGLSPYITHKIPSGFALQLYSYIEKTDELRASFKRPYVFIYRDSHYRHDSKRNALVLDTSAFIYSMNETINKLELYDESGIPIHCSFARLRAEVGRSMIINGYSEKDVADKLGNTSLIVAGHYSTLSVTEEADLWNRHYQATIEAAYHEKYSLHIDNESCTEQKKQYGICKAPNPKCNHPSCDNCKMLITCKEKGGAHNKQPSS